MYISRRNQGIIILTNLNIDHFINIDVFHWKKKMNDFVTSPLATSEQSRKLEVNPPGTTVQSLERSDGDPI